MGEEDIGVIKKKLDKEMQRSKFIKTTSKERVTMGLAPIVQESIAPPRTTIALNPIKGLQEEEIPSTSTTLSQIQTLSQENQLEIRDIGDDEDDEETKIGEEMAIQ